MTNREFYAEEKQTMRFLAALGIVYIINVMGVVGAYLTQKIKERRYDEQRLQGMD